MVLLWAAGEFGLLFHVETIHNSEKLGDHPNPQTQFTERTLLNCEMKYCRLLCKVKGINLRDIQGLSLYEVHRSTFELKLNAFENFSINHQYLFLYAVFIIKEMVSKWK
jgi:hypothetical protein